MTTTRRTAHPAVATYVGAVRDELGDLPPDELAEITEDVRDHLDHVAAEYGDDVTVGMLIDRLGAPAAYAAELRAAAGLPEPDPEPAPPPRTGFVRGLVRFMVAAFGWGAVGLGALAFVDALFGLSGAPEVFAVPALVAAVIAVAAALLLVTGRQDPVAELRQVPTAPILAQVEEWVRSMPWGRPAIELVTSLRPAWWIARAAALGLLLTWVTGSVPFGVAVFLIALIGSVWLGRRTAAGEVRGRRLLGVQVANAALAIGGLVVAATAVGYATGGQVQYVDGGYDYMDPGFYDENGAQITNIFPYGADGTLLENVRLYDQDGNPLDLGWVEECVDHGYMGSSFTEPNPWGDHVFPRLTVGFDEMTGLCSAPVVEAPFGEQLPGTQPPGTTRPPGTQPLE